MATVETPFGTLADDHTPFEESLLSYRVRIDLGGASFATDVPNLDAARVWVDNMPAPEGYSSHSATVYEWSTRVVDGKPYLRALARFHFGELVEGSL